MRARVLAGIVPLLALASLVFSVPATAAGPVAVGWWNLAHQQFQPPAPPDVGAEDLLLQSGPGSPSAYAALRFVVPPDAVVGPLVLPLGSSSAIRADAVVACPTTQPWQPVRNGRFAEAPTYSCSRTVAAVRSEDGASLVLAGIARLVAEDGTLDFVLLPGPSDRVVLAPPPATALSTTSPTPSQGPAPFEPGPVFSPPASGGFTPGDPPTALPPTNPFLPPPALTPGAPAAPPLAPPLTAPPTTGPPTRVAGPVPVASRADDDRTRLLVAAEAVLVLAFFGLLGYGPLRRLQQLTGDPLPEAERARGIGRFSSVRSGDRVPHL